MLSLNRVDYHPATSKAPVLQGITLTANKGETVIISGPSGSGKTSLIEIIGGLASQKEGEIKWEGITLSTKARRSLCGVVFQFPERHFLGLTISQELQLGHRRISTEKKLKALTQVGLKDIELQQAPERLSGGQQRRLAVAIQLIRKPKILILDEPTAGLDWSVRNEILELFKYLSKEQLLIICTHEPELFNYSKVSSYQLVKGKINSTDTITKVIHKNAR